MCNTELIERLKETNESFMVTDAYAKHMPLAGGALFAESAARLSDSGYGIKVLNLMHPEDSDRYNPLVYVRTGGDIDTLVQCVIDGTDVPGFRGGSCNDRIYREAEESLLHAIFGYALERRSIPAGVGDMPRGGDVSVMEGTDRMFAALADRNPDNPAVADYRRFRKLADRSRGFVSIWFSVHVRLAPFFLQSVSRMTEADDLGLDRLSREERKQWRKYLIRRSREKRLKGILSLGRRAYDGIYSCICKRVCQHGSC